MKLWEFLKKMRTDTKLSSRPECESVGSREQTEGTNKRERGGGRERERIKVGNLPSLPLTHTYICLSVHMTHGLVSKGIISRTQISPHNVTRVHGSQLIAS